MRSSRESIMNIFNYESKVSQVLMFVADLIILNVCFIFCCIPVFTIGAAQAALYSGVRTLLDPETDEKPRRIFFKEFVNGFKSITGAWAVGLLPVIFFAVMTILCTALAQSVKGAPVVLCLIGLAVSMVWSSQIPLFHSRFTCTARQLWRNSAILVILHPLRSILLTILLWAPAILFLWDTFLFFATTPAWALLYFALAFMLSFMAMKKPFNKFIKETTPQEATEAAPEEI